LITPFPVMFMITREKIYKFKIGLNQIGVFLQKVSIKTEKGKRF
jgi:hypothetical protein